MNSKNIHDFYDRHLQLKAGIERLEKEKTIGKRRKAFNISNC